MTGWCDVGMVRKGTLDKGAETNEILKEYEYSEAGIAKLISIGITANSAN